ncbi:hypothetical protein GVN24_29395 [Rhizobium sp. CRIBSB]|nr:hypothetical protein [Rhizobium sp. CRIBSB]
MPRPPHWIPWLGPVAAVAAGAAAARLLGGDIWVVLVTALICGFAPILGYRLWKRLHHKKTD